MASGKRGYVIENDGEEYLFMKLITFYFIHVFAHSSTLPFTFCWLAQHNQLALSKNRRLCSISHKNMAVFESEDLANEFLAHVKKKPFWEYSVEQMTDYSR